MSSAADFNSFQGSIWERRRFISVITFSALAGLSQKPGSPDWFSLSAMAFSIAGTSKTPPNVEDVLSQRGDGHFKVFKHTQFLLNVF